MDTDLENLKAQVLAIFPNAIAEFLPVLKIWQVVNGVGTRELALGLTEASAWTCVLDKYGPFTGELESSTFETHIKLLVEHGNVYELASFIRDEYDGLSNYALEPLLFRLLDLLLPAQATQIGFPPEDDPARYGFS